jgi:hypothetical protein
VLGRIEEAAPGVIRLRVADAQIDGRTSDLISPFHEA